jgi:hypothetical protein
VASPGEHNVMTLLVRGVSGQLTRCRSLDQQGSMEQFLGQGAIVAS